MARGYGVEMGGGFWMMARVALVSRVRGVGEWGVPCCAVLGVAWRCDIWIEEFLRWSSKRFKWRESIIWLEST